MTVHDRQLGETGQAPNQQEVHILIADPQTRRSRRLQRALQQLPGILHVCEAALDALHLAQRQALDIAIISSSFRSPADGLDLAHELQVPARILLAEDNSPALFAAASPLGLRAFIRPPWPSIQVRDAVALLLHRPDSSSSLRPPPSQAQFCPKRSVPKPNECIFCGLRCNDPKLPSSSIQDSLQQFLDSEQLCVGRWELELGSRSIHWSSEVSRILGLSGHARPSLELLQERLPAQHWQRIQSTVQQLAQDAAQSSKNSEEEQGHAPALDLLIQCPAEGEESRVIRIVGEVLSEDKHQTRLAGFVMDSSHRSRAEKRLAREIERAMLLLELYEQASVLSEHELFRFALQKTLDLTESRIGFLHLISEDQRKVILTAWSAEVSKQCTTIHATHYPIEEAGLWVDCVHHGRPMIFNDYLRTPHRKGLPPGHAAVNRFMSVPVIIKGKARIVFGVGNKVGPYDQHDVVQLQLVANELGKFLEARRTESALLQSQASFRLLVERAPVAVAIIHRDDRSLRYLNPAALELLGFQAEDIPELESFLQRAVTKEADAEAIRAWDESSPLRISDLHLRCLDGATRIVDLTLVANDELIFLFASDLSARVCAQLALREQLAFEEYIRGLLARLSTTPAELMSLQLHTEVRALVSFLAARACQLIPAQTLERVFQTIAWPSKSQFSPRLPPADLDDIIERAPQQMLAPLRSSGNLLGYLELHLCQRPTTHTPSKQQLAMLADAFATALDKLRAESVVRQQHAELALLNRIMFMATLHQDPRTVFDYACRELKNGFEVEHIAILDTATTKAENDGQRFQVPIPNKSGEAKSLTIDPLQEPLSNEQVSLLNSVAHILATVIDRAWANETQRRLLTAIEQTPESIVITDRNANIQYVNPAFERITGYRSEEVRGRNPRLLSAGDTEPAHFEGMWETISQGQVWHGRFTNRTKEGLIFVEDAVIAPVYDDEQQLVSYIGIKRDITQELEIEAQFRHAQKFEAVGQLAGSVAHDFNNHLAAILLQLHSLHSEEALSEDAAQTVQDLINTVRRASTLTRQLLLFSRRQALTATQQDLNSVVEEFVRTLGRLFGEHIELVFSPAPQSLPFIGDVGMLEQVLMNLCVNARDAMPQGGRLNIHTSMELPCVEFEPPAGRIGKRSGRLGEQRPHVVLSVLDEGTGLDAAQLEQLFEPFFTTKPINQGTGLGLATVAAIVAQHHGWLEVDTAPAQGSRFRVFLPSRICRDSQPSLPPIPPKQRGKEGILLVEDDPVIRDATRVCLQRWGYRVFSAANGVKALELWAQHLSSIDLLLSDMVMPEGLSGLDLSIRMRREKPTLGVIITSGYSVDMAKLGLSPEHDLVFIPKPYDPNLLAQAIRNCLNAHRAPNS